MKTSLHHISDIKTGIFAKPEPYGDVVYLQVKHFGEFGELLTEANADLKADNIQEKHLLKRGDVLFAAKGSRNFAAVFQSFFPAVASTAFFVIRLKEPIVLPEYLSWLLNNPTNQALLKRHAIGSSIVSISKTVLEHLEITVPSIETQKRLLEVSRLSKKEYELRLKIAELRQTQIDHQIARAIK